MSLSIFDELSVEFRNVYNVLSDFESIEYLEQFKAEKPTQIKDLRAYNVLKNNLVRLSFEHNRTFLEEELKELKQQYNDDLKSRVAPKQELINELVKKSYEKFEEFNNINLQFSTNNPFDFAKAKIRNTHKSNIDPLSNSKTKLSFGDFTRQCFLNLQGKSREHLSKAFEDLFNEKIVNKLAEKMSGRLFNLYAQAQKGKLRDQKGPKEQMTHRETKMGKIQLNSYDYKEAYQELRDLKKVLKNYVPNSKVDDLLKEVKNRSKQIFKSATFEKDKMREIEQELEALRKENEALKKAQAPKEPKDDNKGTSQAQEAKEEPKEEQDTKEELKEVFEVVIQENELLEAEIIEEEQPQEPQETKRVFKLDTQLTELSEKYRNIPKGYFYRIANSQDYIIFQQEKEAKRREEEVRHNENIERNKKILEAIKASQAPQEAKAPQEKKDDSQAKEERAKKLQDLKAQAQAIREQDKEKEAQEREAKEAQEKKNQDDDRNSHRKR